MTSRVLGWSHVCPVHGRTRAVYRSSGQGTWDWYCTTPADPGVWADKCYKKVEIIYDAEVEHNGKTHALALTAAEVYSHRDGVTVYPAVPEVLEKWTAGEDAFDGLTIVEKDFGGK